MKKYTVTREVTMTQEVMASSPEEAGSMAVKLGQWRSVKDCCVDITLTSTDESSAILEIFEKDDQS